MGLVRWAPWMLMLAADVFPGGCCGGTRYVPPGPPAPERGMMIVNRGAATICSVAWARDTGSAPASYASLAEMRLEPGGSKLVHYPVGAGEKFVLHVLSCDSKILLDRPGLVPQEGVVPIEVP